MREINHEGAKIFILFSSFMKVENLLVSQRFRHGNMASNEFDACYLKRVKTRSRRSIEHVFNVFFLSA
jgi:hypothetical protein